ncbi:hypothetical protein AC1031_010850 [Aphanomyces cochlioides]|nr:hypothetical protein AC1031_010850 [Aphanomyces cochlioides]
MISKKIIYSLVVEEVNKISGKYSTREQALAPSCCHRLGLSVVSTRLQYETIAPSYAKNRDTDFIGADNLSHWARAYIGTASAKDPMVSPILGDFRGCCPMLIHYGGKEVFEDDIDALCERLKEQQVDETAVKNPLAPHNTPIMPALFGDMASSGGEIIAAFLAKFA